MAQAPRKYLFVSGCSRSGTTLITHILAAQRNMCVRSDLLFELHVAAERCGGFRRELDPRQRDVVLSMAKWSLRGEHAELRFGPNDFSTVDEAYRRALDAVARDDDLIVGHKVNCSFPYSARILDETEHLVLYVVRDPRDVALSRQHFVFDQDDPHMGTALWRESMRALRRHRGHPRLLVMRFEDLVGDFDATARTLASFLHAEVSRVPEVRGHNGKPWLDNSAFHDVDRLLDPRAVGRFRAHLDDPVVRFAAFHCRGELRELGYEPFPESFGMKERVRFTRIALLREAHNGARVTYRQLMGTLRR